MAVTTHLGLSETEAAQRLATGLGNVARRRGDRSYLQIVAEHSLPAVNLALFAVSLVLFLIGLPVDALVTLGPVLANVLISIGQEVRAKRQLDRITLLHQPMARVVRGGRRRPVRPDEIVVGDLVVLARGDEVVADGPIIDGAAELDESQLTGEAEPVARGAGERVTSGSVCVSGELLYRADQVAEASLAGQLVVEGRRLRRDRTPVQQVVQRVIVAVAVIIVAVGLLHAVAALRSGLGWVASVQNTAVLITLVPQGLLAIITITYAVGAIEVARRGALVQRVGALESMSHVDLLCADKTGTLTSGRLRLANVAPVGRAVDADPGEGARIRGLLARFTASQSSPTATSSAIAASLTAEPAALAWEISFSSARRWSALAFADGGEDAFLLGAAEPILPAIRDRVLRAAVAEQVEALASSGRRVLVFATSGVSPAWAALRRHDAAGRRPDLQPLAVVSLEEELRPDAREVLEELCATGVTLKVLSGDDPRTVASVAAAARIPIAGAPLSGEMVERLDDVPALDLVAGTSLLGRVGPHLKARIVALLRGAGHAVAMLGDGVNDLLPIKRANLGIAMESGSPATRSAADLVLLDDDFGALPAVLQAGQRIVAAMRVTLELLLSRTFAMLAVVAVIALLGLDFPLTPRSNSILALVTVGIPILVLALIVPPSRPPRRILRSALRFAIPAGLGIAALAIPVYAVALRATGDLPLARTLLIHVAVLCGLGLITLLADFRPGRHVTARGEEWRLWLLAALMALLYLLIVAVPLTRSFFDLSPTPLPLAVLAAGLATAWTVAAHLLARRVTPALLRLVERRIDDGARSSGDAAYGELLPRKRRG
jgi:cation-transporting ATPase E